MTRDRGSVDVSIEMLFGAVLAIVVLLSMFEAAAYWHTRNVLDDAASEGVRVAAAFDGSCDDGIAAARAEIAARSSSWAQSATITCTDAPIVTVAIRGVTPGVLGGVVGYEADVRESAPKER